MKLASSSLLCLLLCSLFCLLAAPAPGQEAAAPAPRVVLKEPVVSLGIVPRGKVVRGQFALENQGSAALELLEVRASCACTVPSYDRTIAPGGTGAVHVDFDSKSFEGPIVQRLEVFTNDPKTPRLTLTVKADVRPYIVSKPGYIRYIVVQGFEEDSTIKQKLWAIEGDFEVVRVESQSPDVTATFHPATKEELEANGPPRQWVVETRISPDATVGPLSGYLNVYVKHPQQSLVPIPLSGFVRPVLAVTPADAIFGTIKPESEAEPVRGSIKVQNFATAAHQITKVELDVEAFATRVETEKEGYVYYVVVELKPNPRPGPFAGKLRIHTTSARMPVIEVPVSGTIETSS